MHHFSLWMSYLHGIISVFKVHGNAHTLHVSLFIHKVPFARSSVIGWTGSTQRYVSIRDGQWERSSAADAPASSARRVQCSSCVQLPQFLKLFNTVLREQFTVLWRSSPGGETLKEVDVESSEAGERRCRCIRSGSQSGVSCASPVGADHSADTCTGSIYTMKRWKELQLSHWTVALGDIRRPLCSFAFLS